MIKKNFKTFKLKFRNLNFIQVGFFLAIFLILFLLTAYLNYQAKEISNEYGATYEEIQNAITQDIENPVEGGINSDIKSMSNKFIWVFIFGVLVLSFLKAIKDDFVFKEFNKKKTSWKDILLLTVSSFLTFMLLFSLVSLIMIKITNVNYYILPIIIFLIVNASIQTILPFIFFKKIKFNFVKEFSKVYFTSLSFFIGATIILLVLFGYLLLLNEIIARIVFGVLFFAMYFTLRNFTSVIYYKLKE